MVLASMAVPKRLFFHQLSKIRVTLEGIKLVYYPFVLKGSELVQSEVPIGINSNALTWGRLM
jgi:hypothetical protein